MKFNSDNPLARLAWSRYHAQAIEHEVQAWIDRNPYGLVQQVNADSTRYSLVLREIEAPPFARWTLMFGDALNNLRSALDYLVYEIAIADTGQDPPEAAGRLQFPLTDCRCNFDEAVNRKQLGKISDPVRAAFEKFQPFNRPHKTLPPLLSILRELNNTHKHRMLRLAYSVITQGEVGFHGNFPDDGRQWAAIPNMGEIKDNTEVFAMVCDRPSPYMQWDLKFIQIAIAVGHDKRDPSGPEFTGHTEFTALFKALSEEVQAVIFGFTKW